MDQLTETYCEIPLSRGLFAKVSRQDLERVSALKWSALPQKHTCYAQTRYQNGWVMLHRFVMDAQKGQIVDHANGDGLDCRRENLRFCTWGQNSANSKRSGTAKNPYRGVQKYRKHYRARIRFNGKNYYLKGYPTAEEAARSYDQKARELFGPFARLNFPEASR